MLLGTGITIAGYTLTSFELLVTGALFLCAAAILLAYRREMRMTLRQSAATDEIFVQLQRVASALEQIADQEVNRRIAQVSLRTQTAEKGKSEPERAGQAEHRVAYSMFGR